MIQPPLSFQKIARSSSASRWICLSLATAALGMFSGTSLFAQNVSGSIFLPPVISTVAGSGTAGYSGDGGLATAAELSASLAVAVDGVGNLYIADSASSRVRKVDPDNHFPATSIGSSSSAQTILVQLQGTTPISNVNASATRSGSKEFSIESLSGCVIDGTTSNVAGTICTVTVAFNPSYPGMRAGTIVVSNGKSTIGTIGLYGIGVGPELVESPGLMNIIAGGGNSFPSITSQSATSTQLAYPYGIAIDDVGNLYIADTWNNLIEEVDAKTGKLRVIAGGGQTVPSSIPESAINAELSAPTNLVLDGAQNLYISDMGNNLIEKIDASTGNIVVVAGGGGSLATTDSQLATNVMLNWPYGLALDSAGNLYIGDSGNYFVEKLSLANNQLTVVAGGGGSLPGSTPIAATAALFIPYGLAVDTKQNIYIADFLSGMIEKVEPGSGLLASVAGGGGTVPGIAPILATDAFLSGPYNVAVDGAGDLYVADTGNNLIEKVDASSGQIRRVAGGGYLASSDSFQPATSAALQQPIDIAIDGNGNLYVAEFGSGAIDQVGISAVLPFSSLLVGETSPTQSAWIANIGNASLTLNALNNPPDYPLQGGGSCTVGANSAQILASGDSCNLPYVFQPTTGGTLNEIATLTDDSLGTQNAQHQIFLNGTSLSIVTTLALSASPSQTTVGNSVALTATVLSSQGVPTGTVTFSSGATVLGSTAVNGSGIAALNTTVLAVGTDTVTAKYTASGNYAPSTGTAIVTIVAAPLGYAISLSPTSLILTQGQDGNSTLTINPQLGFAGNLVLKCLNAPTDASCAFTENNLSTTTVSLSGNGQPVVINVAVVTALTQARRISSVESRPSNRSFPAFALMSVGFALWFPGGLTTWISFRKVSQKSGVDTLKTLGLAILVVAWIGFTGLTGCADRVPAFAQSSQPKEAFTLTISTDSINGANPGQSHIATLSVTVLQ